MLLDPKGPCFSCPAGPLLPKAVAAVLGWTPELSFRLLVPSLGLGFPTCKWVSRQFWVFPSRGALAPLPHDLHKAHPSPMTPIRPPPTLTSLSRKESAVLLRLMLQASKNLGRWM